MVEVKEAVSTTLDPAHLLCVDTSSHLTTLKQNYVLFESTMREEVSVMKRDLRAI